MNEAEDTMIDRYLAGQLSAEESIAFASRLKTEVPLRQRVDLRRELIKFAGSGENELMDLLAVADEKHYQDPSPTSFRLWWLLPILLPPLAFFFWPTNNEPAVTTPEVEMSETAVLKPLQDSLQKSTYPPAAAPDRIAPPAPSAPAAAPPKTSSPTTTPKPAEKPPIFAQLDLADFRPNPLLEDIVAGQLRSGTDSTSIVLPFANDTLRLDGSTLLRGFSTTPPPYTLIIYDNDTDRFINDQPIIRATVAAEQEGNGFSFAENLKQLDQPGIYYLVLVNKNGEVFKGLYFLAK